MLPSIPAGLMVEAWPPMVGVRGPALCRTLHAHHAMHFVLAAQGELRVRTSPHGRWTSAAGVLTAPDVPHAIDGSGLNEVIVFFDPESDVGASLRQGLSDSVRFISGAERAELARGVTDPESFAEADTHEWSRRAAATLGLTIRQSESALHPCVRRLLARLRTSGLTDTSLEGLAAALGLSPSRLMHVFTESVGIPLRRYLAWLRVQRAACAILAGTSVSQAAHTAGFADAAHLSRTFKRNLGFPPSALRRMRCEKSGERESLTPQRTSFRGDDVRQLLREEQLLSRQPPHPA